MFAFSEEHLSPEAIDILEKAYALFVERGFKSTELKEIEGVTGVPESEIERLFQTKSDILLRCMLRHLKDLYNVDDLTIDLGNKGDYMTQLMDAIIQYYKQLSTTHKDLLYETFMVQHADASIHMMLTTQMRELKEKEYMRIVEFLRNTVEASGVRLNIKVAARCVTLVLEGEFARYVTNKDQTFEEMMRLVRQNMEFMLSEKLKTHE